MKVHQLHGDGLRARQSVEEAIVWRGQNLSTAGFDPALATSVAHDLRVDLHEVLQLVDRGCPPELAVQILESLPSEVGE